MGECWPCARKRSTARGGTFVFSMPGRGEELSTLDTGKDQQYALAFARDEKLAAVIAGANVVVYDLSAGSERKRFAIPASCTGSREPRFLAVTPRADAFVLASANIICRLDEAGNQVWVNEACRQGVSPEVG